MTKTNYEEIENLLDNPTEIEKELDENWQIKKIVNEPITETLTKRQLRFCELYALDSECFGNWVQAYLEVYDIDTSKPGWYKTACAWASRLLSNVKVYTKINWLLEEHGLNDEFVDKQLLFLISQQDDKTNKLWAIKEYNKLKKRIDEKIELNTNLKVADEDRDLIEELLKNNIKARNKTQD